MDPRWLPSVIAAMAGCVAAAGAAMSGSRPAAAVAAVAALVSGVSGLRTLEGLQRLERTAAANAAASAEKDETIERLTMDLADANAELERALQLTAAVTDAEPDGESVLDPETGLPDVRVFEVVFDRKVAAARRHLRPLTLLLAEIHAARDGAVPAFGHLLRRTLRDADIACRLGPATFALILDDTPEAGGVWTAERLQIAAAAAASGIGPVAIGVATYPSSGLRADEVYDRGLEALQRAMAGEGDGLGPVEVARGDVIDT